MKILFVNPVIYTSETAEIKRVNTIKDTMSYDLCLAFQKQGMEVTLFAGDAFQPTEEETYPFEVIWAKCENTKLFKPNVLPYCPEIKALVKERGFDLIISSEVFSLNSLMLARRCKSNLIIWHELAKHNRLMKQIPSKFWYGVIARLFFRNARIVARSIEARTFISRYCRNVSSTIIDHGVNLEKFVPSPVKEDYFLVSAQLVKRKQVDKIIEKFAAFSATHPTFKLYIFGEGELEKTLRDMVIEKNLHDKITFFGRAAHDLLKIYLAKAKGLLVYTKKDNNMISVVEAIACGTPILTTDVPYNASYIRANGLGMVKDNWDETDLESFLRDNHQYIANCLAYRNELSADAKVDLFLKERNRL